MMNITPDPTNDSAPVSTPSPIDGVLTPIPSGVDETGSPVTPGPTEDSAKTNAPVTPSPSSTSSTIPETVAPVTISSFPSPAGDVSLPPVSSAPPQIGSLPTLPPVLSAPPVLPTSLPPQASGNLPTLPPQSGQLPTLPPALSAPPILPTLPPELSSPPVLPSTSPPQIGSLPTLPPGTFESLVPSVANVGELSWTFENGVFPEAPWTTEGAGVWAIDQTQVADGLYSIKSPDLETEYVEGTGILVSNATLTLDDSFSGGVLKFKVLAR